MHDRGAISLIVSRHQIQSIDLRAERAAIIAFFAGGHWRSAADAGRVLDYAPNEIVLRLRHLAGEGLLQLGTRDPSRQPGRGNELFARLKPAEEIAGSNSYASVDERSPPVRVDIPQNATDVPPNWPGASSDLFDRQVNLVIDTLRARAEWMATAEIADTCELSSSRTSEVLRYLTQRYHNIERRKARNGRGLEFRFV